MNKSQKATHNNNNQSKRNNECRRNEKNKKCKRKWIGKQKSNYVFNSKPSFIINTYHIKIIKHLTVNLKNRFLLDFNILCSSYNTHKIYKKIARDVNIYVYTFNGKMVTLFIHLNCEYEKFKSNVKQHNINDNFATEPNRILT